MIAFFADPRLRASQIVIGQYLGIFGLLLISVGSLAGIAGAAAGLPRSAGILPVYVGLKKLIGLWREYERYQATPSARAGAVLTVGCCHDDQRRRQHRGLYAVFATHFGPEIIIIAGVFAVMTAVWLAAAHLLVNNPQFGAPTPHRPGVRAKAARTATAAADGVERWEQTGQGKAVIWDSCPYVRGTFR